MADLDGEAALLDDATEAEMQFSDTLYQDFSSWVEWLTLVLHSHEAALTPREIRRVIHQSYAEDLCLRPSRQVGQLIDLIDRTGKHLRQSFHDFRMYQPEGLAYEFLQMRCGGAAYMRRDRWLDHLESSVDYS